MATSFKRCECPNKDRTMCGHKWYSNIRIGGKQKILALSLKKAESDIMLAEMMKEQKLVRSGHGDGPAELPIAKFREMYRDWARVNKHERTTSIEETALDRVLKTVIKEGSPRYVSEMTPAWLGRVKAAWVKEGKVELRAGMGYKGAPIANRRIRAIKTIMRRAHMEWREEFNIPDFNWRTVEYFKLPNGGHRVACNSMEELQRIELGCYGFYYTAFYLAYLDGLRLAEARWLWINDLDFKNDKIKIRGKSWMNPWTKQQESWTPKGNKERTLPMNSLLKRHLLKVVAKHPGTSPFVICYEDGRPPSEAVLSARFRKICSNADVHGYLHKLRHSFATSYVENSSEAGQLNPVKLQEMLGHTTLKMSMRYVHAAGLAGAGDVEFVASGGLGQIEHRPQS